MSETGQQRGGDRRKREKRKEGRKRAREEESKSGLTQARLVGLDFSKAAACITRSGMSLDATLCFVDNLDDEPAAGEEAVGGCGAAQPYAAAISPMSGGEKVGMWNSSLVGGYQSFVESDGSGEPYVFYSGAEPHRSR